MKFSATCKHVIFGMKSQIIVVWKVISEHLLIWIIKLIPGSAQTIINGSVKQILIPLLHGIGDAVIIAPVLRDISVIFEDARITVLTTSRTHEVIMEFFPEFDYIQYSGLRKLGAFRQNFDLIINPDRCLKNYLINMVLRPDYLVGFNFSQSIKKGENHFTRAERLLIELGGTPKGRPAYDFFRSQYSEKEIKELEKLKNEYNVIICVIVGGRWCSKTYPVKRSLELITRLSGYDDTAVVLLGTNETQGCLLSDGVDNVVNLCGSLTIKQVMDCIKQAALLIGPDGGLLHIAIAMGTPFIGIFSSVDPAAVIPEQLLHCVVMHNVCPYQPCYNEDHEPFCPFESPGCIDIDPELIIDKINKIYPALLNKVEND